MKFLLKALCLLVFINTTMAQDGELILSPVKEYKPIANHYQKVSRLPKLKTGIGDTLQLPFIDDFSRITIFPDPLKWTDNAAYVNDHFSINPPSYGMVTLDGLDNRGRAYNGLAPTVHGPNDTLTSQPINLAGLSSTDNIYLTFFYQQQGLNNQRMTLSDSLVLYFKNLNGGWQPVWSTRDTLQRPFQPVSIKVDNVLFFHAGFQFKFINFQNYLGNLKMWHLDYFIMNRNRSAADTTFPDLSVCDPPRSIFREYISVPYAQFSANPQFFLDDDASMLVNNLSTTQREFKYRRTIRNNSGQTILNFTQNNTQTIPPFQNLVYTFTAPISPITETRDTVIYTVTHSIFEQGVDINRTNDSAVRNQFLSSFYAMDDGSAESGISIRNSPGAFAMYVPLTRPDTLRGVMMHFTQAEALNNVPFQIAVYKSINMPGVGTTTEILYQQRVPGPFFTDSVNGFHTFRFDSGIFVAGEFLIGWVQNNIGLLNVGWDYNFRISGQLAINPNLFYFVQGSWRNAGVPGTVMIRPFFGRANGDTLVSAKKIENQRNISFYPNPADDFIEFTLPANSEKVFCNLYDLSGKALMSKEISTEGRLDISLLHSGMYLMLLNDSEGRLLLCSKFIRK